MKNLIVGGTGATGKQLVKELLSRGENVTIIVRSSEKLPEDIKNHPNLSIIEANILDISEDEMVSLVKDCNSVASCLGHNITFKGIWGQPRMLVTEATARLCNSIKKSNPNKFVKFILMNTTGNRNRNLKENISLAERIIIGLIRFLIPPQLDNEKAADYLRTKIGQKDNTIKWVAVRPDSLIDEKEVSKYEIHPSPTRSAIFNPGKTSRINVSHFMADLITDNTVWEKWIGQMPVIYNKE